MLQLVVMSDGIETENKSGMGVGTGSTTAAFVSTWSLTGINSLETTSTVRMQPSKGLRFARRGLISDDRKS